MTIPRTWDELISKSKTIFEEEKNIGNTVIRYNGLINGKIIITYIYKVILFIIYLLIYLFLYIIN